LDEAVAAAEERGAPAVVVAAGGTPEDDEEEELSAATLRGKPRPPPLSALSAFSYIPPRRLDPKEHSYYYRQAKERHLWHRTGDP